VAPQCSHWPGKPGARPLLHLLASVVCIGDSDGSDALDVLVGG
jgi:hypothetical protein